MKPHQVTIKITVYAENDDSVIRKTNELCKKLQREEGVNPEVETIVELKKFSLFDRIVDYHRIKEKLENNEKRR